MLFQKFSPIIGFNNNRYELIFVAIEGELVCNNCYLVVFLVVKSFFD